MKRPFRVTPLAYVLAIVLVLLAGLTRWSLAPVDAGFPFITFIGACTLAALLGGLGAGFLALVLSLLAAKYFFIAPYMSLSWPTNSNDSIVAMAFVLMQSILIFSIKFIQFIKCRNIAANHFSDYKSKRTAYSSTW